MSNTINIGGVTVSKFYLGNDDDVQIYLGTTKLYPQDTPVAKDYLRTVARDSGTVSLVIGQNVNTSNLSYVAYSLDSGGTWTTVNNVNATAISASTNVSSGDVVYWKGEGTTLSTKSASQSGGIQASTIFSSTCNFDVEGNAMSILFGDNFENKEFDSGSTYHLSSLFYNATRLVNASGLTLPATTVYDNDYNDMFNGCTSLTTAPNLPATTIGASSYKRMFNKCSSLTSAPSVWSATTIGEQCCLNMFSGCTSLTTAPIELPATTLGSRCYEKMFYGCKNLTTAPELPAATLVSGCYNSMFRNCSKLTSITCLATNISASNCLTTWVSGVASSGTFTKAASMSSWTTGTSGIPSNWTVQDYSG